MMFEILSQTKQTIVAVPLDPEKMTALIQQINSMYSTTFSHYLTLFAIITTCLGILVAAILSAQNFFSKKDIADTKAEVKLLKSELESIKLQKHQIEQLQKQYDLLKEELSRQNTRIREQRKIDEKHNFYLKYMHHVDDAYILAKNKNEPIAAIVSNIATINECLKKITREESNRFEELGKENADANGWIGTIISRAMIDIATDIPQARRQAIPTTEARSMQNWEERLKTFIKNYDEHSDIVTYDLHIEVQAIKDSLRAVQIN